MASSRKTLEVDVITLNSVNIRGPQNSLISSSCVLVSDGAGGTYWSPPSLIGAYPTFNVIQINDQVFTANPLYPYFSLQASNGIGFADAGPGMNTAYIYAKAFQTLVVPGQTPIQSFSNSLVNSNINLSSIGPLAISTDTTTNTVYFRAGINTINVLSNTSTVASNYTGVPQGTLPITAAVSTLTFAGLGDIYLETDVPSNSIYVGVNGYTVSEYLQLSNTLYTLSSSVYSNASSFFISKQDFSTAISTLSTQAGTIITSQINLYAFSNYGGYLASTVSTFSTLSYGFYHSTILSTTAYTLSSISTYTCQSLSTISTFSYAMSLSTLSTVQGGLLSTNYSYSTLVFSTYGQVYSTLSSYQQGISTIELQSTTSGLLSSINTMQLSTIISMGGFVSSLSTSITNYFMTAIVPKISIVSSLASRGIYNSTVQFYTNPYGSTFTSTLSINFSSVVSSIKPNASVYLEYNPVLLYPMALNNQVTPQLIQTYLQYDYNGTRMPVSQYDDYMNFNQYNAAVAASDYTSNLYSKYLRLTLDPDYITSNGCSSYTLYHVMPTGSASIYNYSQIFNSTVNVRISAKNSLYLNIFNVN